MEIFFSEIARQIALVIAGLSLAGMTTFFVSYSVTSLWARIRERTLAKKSVMSVDTPATDDPMIVAEISLPDTPDTPTHGSGSVGQRDAEDHASHISDAQAPEELRGETKTLSPESESDVISTSKSSEIEAVQAEGTPTEQDELMTEQKAPVVPLKPEEIERIKKPDTSPLQGDIYVSTVPHIDKKEAEDGIQSEEIIHTVSQEHIESIKTHMRRTEYTKAHTLIVEWLSHHKDHRELNVFLAEIYETEGAYDRAELLYADIIRKHGKDAHLLSKLALMLSFGGKYDTSLELYREALLLESENDEIMSMVMNLSAYLGHHQDSFALTEKYLTKYPRHIDSLELQAKNTIELGYEDRYQEIITLLRSLAGFDARTHARVADLIALHESRASKSI